MKEVYCATIRLEAIGKKRMPDLLQQLLDTTDSETCTATAFPSASALTIAVT